MVPSNIVELIKKIIEDTNTIEVNLQICEIGYLYNKTCKKTPKISEELARDVLCFFVRWSFCRKLIFSFYEKQS